MQLSGTNQRQQWPDVLKGIAIMAVVLSHHPRLPGTLLYTLSFVVPLFCFVSGYFFNPDVPLRKFVAKRFNSLLRPYFFTLVIVSVAYVVIKGSPSIFWHLFWIFYGNGPNLPKVMLHLWFLPNLFLVTLLAWVLFKYCKHLKSSASLQLIFIIGFLAVGASVIHLFWNVQLPLAITNYFGQDGNSLLINGLLNNPAYSQNSFLADKHFVLKGLPWSLDFIMITMAFFMGGYLFRQQKYEKLIINNYVALSLAFVLVVLYFRYNHIVDLNCRRYDDLLISTAECFVAICLLMYFSSKIAKINNGVSISIQYVGRYSLVVYIFHPPIQSKVYYMLSAIFPPSVSFVTILLALAAGILGPLLLNWLFLERLKFFRFWYYAK